MPNIEDFSAGNIDIRPTETGIESVAATGRRMGAYGSQIAQSYQQIGRDVGQAVNDAQKYLEHREINTGAKQAADFTASHNQSWNDYIGGKDIPQDAPDREDQISARISNPNSAQQWREKQLEPDLQQFRSGFLTPGGREWADHFVNTYREHMTVKSASDQSSMAGAVVQANIEKTTNTLAATTFNDPSSLKTNIDLLSHSIEGSIQSSPTLSAEHSIKVSTELKQKTEEKLVQAAIQGAILKGGDWKAIANDPAYSQYVKPAENAMFERQARTYARMDRAAANQERVQQDYINKQNFNEVANKLEVDTIPTAPGAPPVLPDDYWQRVKKISVMPGVDPGRLQALIRNGEAITDKLGKPEPLGPVSHATTMEAINDLRDGKAIDVDALYGTNKLNNADYGFLKKAIDERRTPEGERLDKDRELFFKRHSMMIDPTMGEHGDRLYNAEMDARRQEQDLIKKGLDPHLAYDPRSEYFIGRPEQLNKWKQPLQAQITPLTEKPPERPEGFPADAQWDAQRRYWYVMQDGKKMIVKANEAKPQYEPGGGGKPMLEIPSLILDALSAWAQGGKAADVHKQMPLGWSAKLNTGKSGVEIIGPDGRVHFVPNSNF